MTLNIALAEMKGFLMKLFNKLLFIFFIMIITTACKIDDKEQDKKPRTLADLENLGLVPYNLDRTNYLTGIDANNNGVRDDVEKYIKDKFPNQIPEAMQFAKALQSKFTVDLKDEQAVRKVSLESVKGIRCLHFSHMKKRKSSQIDLQNPTNIFHEIRSITTNTKERLIAYLKFSEVLDGTVLPRVKFEESCNE